MFPQNSLFFATNMDENFPMSLQKYPVFLPLTWRRNYAKIFLKSAFVVVPTWKVENVWNVQIWTDVCSADMSDANVLSGGFAGFSSTRQHISTWVEASFMTGVVLELHHGHD